jgi:hypothetical protein
MKKKQSIADVKRDLADMDMGAIVLLNDKLSECAYFYELLTQENDRSKFRWLLGAFLNACYGYFEDKASYFHYALCHPETGEPIMDSAGLDVLKKHVKVWLQNTRVKTTGVSKLMAELYKYRNISTHDGGIGIMIKGENLPADFHIGTRRSKGVPALKFCAEVLACFKAIEEELNVQK